MKTVKELARLYIKELKWFATASSAVTNRAEETFIKKMDEGLSSEDIERAIYRYKRAHPTEAELRRLFVPEEIFNAEVFDDEPAEVIDKGLIEDGRFYYHPRLQKSTKPPMLTIDEDGNFVWINANEGFFIDIVDGFTMADLVYYFYEKTGAKNQNYKRDMASFEYIFRQAVSQMKISEELNGLDLMLFAIDAAVALTYDLDRPMPRAIDIEDYLNDGLAQYIEKYDNCKKSGLNHVTTRG